MSVQSLLSAGESRRLIKEAAAWRLLGCLFERPRPGWSEELESLSAEVDDGRLREAVVAARTAREEEHLAHFGPGRAVSPREVSYIGFQDPGQVLAELNAFYGAFGFAPLTEEPADHVAVEAAFVGFLCLKETYARFNGEEEDATRCGRARELFLAGHLARLGQRMPLRLSDAAPAWIRLAADALQARVAHVMLTPDVPTCAEEPEGFCCETGQDESFSPLA